MYACRELIPLEQLSAHEDMPANLMPFGRRSDMFAMCSSYSIKHSLLNVLCKHIEDSFVQHADNNASCPPALIELLIAE